MVSSLGSMGMRRRTAVDNLPEDRSEHHDSQRSTFSEDT